MTAIAITTALFSLLPPPGAEDSSRQSDESRLTIHSKPQEFARSHDRLGGRARARAKRRRWKWTRRRERLMSFMLGESNWNKKELG
jgi:hypothetical protein